MNNNTHSSQLVFDIEKLRSDQYVIALKRSIDNILKSYHNPWDVFSELIQNAIDACQAKSEQNNTTVEEYNPEIHIDIVSKDGKYTVAVTDNGIGINETICSDMFAPNISHKEKGKYRGEKGVGATFYYSNHDHLSISSKYLENDKTREYTYEINGANKWFNDDKDMEFDNLKKISIKKI